MFGGKPELVRRLRENRRFIGQAVEVKSVIFGDALGNQHVVIQLVDFGGRRNGNEEVEGTCEYDHGGKPAVRVTHDLESGGGGKMLPAEDQQAGSKDYGY